MAASISQQLEDLLNPLPNFVDPEDDEDEETKAKVIERFDEGHNDEESASGHLRKRTATILADTDRRYLGKATSRKQLQKELNELVLADEEDDYDDDDDNDANGILEKYMETIDDDDDEEEDDSGDEEDDDDEEDEDQDDNDDEENLIGEDSSQMSSLISKMKGTDLMKFTEGMDDLGDTEDEKDSAEGDEEEGESEEDSEEEEESALRTFSKEKVNEEVDKGKAVQNQLALWDLLLEGRIKMQKTLMTANQLPQSETFSEFKSKGGPEYSEALKNSHKALKALQRSLLELQDQLLYQNPETRGLSQGKTWSANSNDKDDEEINSEDEEKIVDDNEEEQETSRKGPPKRKLEMSEYPSFMAKRFASFQPYRDATLQKWYDKTRLTMGKTNKGFGAFDRNILTQVEQVLMDKERLVRRTQTRRSQYKVLGKPEPIAPEVDSTTMTEGEAAELALKANVHLKDLDEEIFDDDDFYHQLLRELIERKTSAADPNDQVAMGRQWLAIQKLRSKIKKKVDTKASKGRKIRFHVHNKLMNFMAPMGNSSMSDDARSELYRSLFANGPVMAQ